MGGKFDFKLFQSARSINGPAISDAVAGAELAAMSMPQSLGYAGIAGMPAVTGLYTLLLPLIGFAAFGSSRFLVVAADSATAAILAGGLSGLPHAGLSYEMRAALVALLTAVLLLIARVLKLGFLADFLSQTVLTGFLTGVGFQVAIGILPQMTGIAVDSRNTMVRLAAVLRNLPNAHLPSVTLSLLVVFAILACNHISPKIPAPLIAVLGSIAASGFFNFSAQGIATIGTVTTGLPHLSLPEFSWKEIEPLLPIAASCFVMILTQSAAIARLYAFSNHQHLDENADLTGLAAPPTPPSWKAPAEKANSPTSPPRAL
jgi:MFS superfamily sulfate permease-like transporter